MKKRILNVLIGIILLSLLLLITIKVLDLIHFKCIFRKLFNIYCAGCGTTRMIKCILHLRFKKAFMYNPFVFILLILFLIYLIYFIVLYIKTGKKAFLNYKILIVLAITLLIYMLLRNIPQLYFLRPWKKQDLKSCFYIGLYLSASLKGFFLLILSKNKIPSKWSISCWTQTAKSSLRRMVNLLPSIS